MKRIWVSTRSGQAEFFFEDGAVRFDALLGAAKLLGCFKVILIGHRGYLSLLARMLSSLDFRLLVVKLGRV